MSNYAATIVRISNLRKHENADRLQITNIFGNTVVVGLDTQVGDLGVYFFPETQLSEEFAKANDLIRRKDDNGKPAGGMLEESRRVKTIKLRGEKSMGLFLPLTCLDAIGGLSKPAMPLEGFEFEEMNGIKVCQKYIPKQSLTNGLNKVKKGQKPRESKIIDGQFHFHFDTAQLGKNIHKLHPNDLVAITWKLHGTSAIVGNVLVKRKLNLLEKFLTKFLPIKDSQYEYIYASRRVIKNEFMDAKQHFYSYDLWQEVGKQFFEGKLRAGEQVYYEIVGYLKDGGYIQKPFDYQCSPGELKIFVYRITQTSPDGTVTELQWNQVKQRCNQLFVPHVPELYYGKASELFPFLRSEDHWNENYLDHLKSAYVYDQDSEFCNNKVPEEGICVRKEGLDIEVFKLKSFRFLEAETKSLDAGTVDVETEQTVAE